MQHMTGLRGSRLSIQQHHLWDLQQDQQTYWVQCTISIEGSLSHEMLRLALEDVIRQHEILRTIFHRLPGLDIPIQVVSSDSELAFEKYDLQDLSLSELNAHIEATLATVREKPYMASSGPVMHVTLLRYTESKTLLLLSLPALCADISTLKLIISELAQAYAARRQEKLDSTADEVLQYADVSVWQKELLEEEDARLQQTFWAQKNLSQLASLHLPFAVTERVEYITPTPFTPRRLLIESSPLLSLDILKQSGITPAAFFLTCWNVLLWRLTGDEGIPLGVACDGRNYEELTNALGPYTRFVPLIVNFAPEATFFQVLTQIQDALTLANEAQIYFSWEILTTANGKQQNSNFFPLSFEYELWPTEIVAADINFKLQQYFGYTEPFVLKLVLQQIADTLQWELHYDAASIQYEQVQRTAHALHTLLQVAPTHLQTAVSRLPIVEPAEQERLLKAFRGPEYRYSAQTLQQLFEEQAVKRAKDIAVICDNQQLTYEQLHTRANRLAHWLLRHGVGPDVLVCLYVERGLDGLIGLLAILKAGGAYVPLDPDSPIARVAFQIEDTQTPIVLTQEHLLPHLSAFAGQIFCLDRDTDLLVHEPTTPPPFTTNADNLAYVIYTSGSTGVPKGVMIRQQGAVNYTVDMCKRIAKESGLHFATVSTLAADLGNTSIFGSLASGGCLHILAYEILTSGEAFADYQERYPIDVLKIVPSHLQALLFGCHNRAILPQRYLILGGEELSHSLLHTLQQQDAHCTIINHYGPTETTIGVIVNELDLNSELLITRSTVPIGRPLSHVQAYIVDQYQQIVPVGVIGELLIGGVSLATGYLHQTELTQARFLIQSFLPNEQTRVYKTGDLARYTPDGMIEFIGRADRQVKLRGYRIELGEIEATLRQHPQVRGAAVILREDIATERRLVAYIVSDQLTTTLHNNLYGFLQKILPEYMIPALIIQLPMLPLNANGKLDYRALPRPEQSTNLRQTPYAAPRSPIEDILVTIWQDILQSSRIGIYDDFFKAGGHSLLVTQVISRIKTILQVNLPIISLFDAPTIASLAILLESTLRDNHTQTIPAVTAHSRNQDLPLSFSQQRLWFFYQLDPYSTAYNIPFALHIKGKLSVEALEYSLGQVIQRHEVLRTTFVIKNGQPLQQINPWSEYQLEQKSLQELTPQQCEDEVQQLRQEEALHPFDLTQGPLLRTLLLCLVDQEEYVLLLTLHHIISDGWSNGILLRELNTFYMAYIQHETAQLEKLSVQYADYALWQRHYLQGEVLDTQLHYWMQQLDNVVPLDLPTDYPRPNVQSFRGAELNYQFSEDLLEGLKILSQNEGTTLFMTLLASFQIILARYTGQDNIAVGTATANRHHAGVENLLGLFINTLIIRTDLSGNPTFSDLLQRVREVCLSAYAHQDIPFEQVVEALQPERDLSRSPLFQVMFGLQNMPLPPIDLPGLVIDPYQGANTTAKFDLSLTTMENEHGLLCIMEYSTDLFAAETIEHMLLGWQALLAQLSETPHLPIAAFPVLGPNEQAVVLASSQGLQVTSPQPISMHQRFEAQVLLTPDTIAVSCGNMHLSYQTLNQQANRLAHQLQSLDIGPETLVALLAERDEQFLIAVLAIFKTGAAYLPLDPLHPVDRMQQVLQSSTCDVLLSTRRFSSITTQLQGEVGTTEAIRAFILEDLLTQGHCQDNLSVRVSAHQLAYIIYTSGSTGIPKGAMIEQAGMLNHLDAKIADLQITATDCIAQTASQCFDISVWQFLAALLIGARVTIFPTSVTYEPAQILYALAQDGVSIYEVVPSVLKFLLDLLQEQESTRQHLPALRTLLVTGETVPPILCQRWLTLQPHTLLVNAYGPTECSDDVTHHLMRQPPLLETDSISIGRPVANTQVYILDTTLALVPARAYGEIYIGGIGVGRGYCQDPLRTAEVFLPDPFSSQPGSRLYQTGDRARYRPDGSIEFIGRSDDQVKIHGFRIELGEIETHLRHYPGIQDVIVRAGGARQEDKYLIAYVVTSALISSADLHAFLKGRLPQYMVPTAFVQMETFPVTTNGKVDVQALSQLKVQRVETAYQAPRTAVEQTLAHQWETLLEVESIGLSENFFALGGHSLLATRAVAQIRAEFLVELPLRTLFEAPTIGELAQQIETLMHGENTSHLPALRSVERPAQIPLSFAQQRLWFLHQLDPLSGAYNISSAVHLQGYLDRVSLDRALVQLINRHESLRTSFPDQQGKAFQQIMPAPDTQILFLDLSGLPLGQRTELALQLAKQEAEKPFDLVRGPLLRSWLLQIDEQEAMLLLCLHHIISDGLSITILLQELTSLYSAFEQGEKLVLPELPVQYADFALWQHDWLQGSILQKQLDYWKLQLAAISILQLPTDYPRPAVQTFQGARQELWLSSTLSRQLQALSQREGVTLFMTLLAAFQVLLARYSQQWDIAVGSPIANRTREEIKGVIGFFVNTLVLRTDLSGNPSFEELIRRVREVCLNAYAHQDIPFEQVVEALQPERDLSRSPLFQVMFGLQNMPLPPIDLPGLVIDPYQGANTTAKFDLSLTTMENEHGLLCIMEYSTDLFAAETIEHMLLGWQALLAQLTETPHLPIAALPVLGPNEQAVVLASSQGSQVTSPHPISMHQRFEAQVLLTPDTIAVSYGNIHLSYQALNQQANRLAHQLQSLDIGPETLVALLAERDEEFLIAVLAIFKTGAAYLPLDPLHPVDRMQQVLQSSTCDVLLSTRRFSSITTQLQGEVGTTEAIRAFILEDLLTQGHCQDNLSVRVSAHQLAYIIYTSGSTGIPKGAMIEQAGMLNHLDAKIADLQITATDCIAQTASQCFDISVWQFLAALLVGARVTIFPTSVTYEPVQILHALAQDGVSIYEVVPSVLKFLLDLLQEQESTRQHLPALRTLLVTGETVPPILCQRWLTLQPHTLLVNAYGPTECSDDVTHHLMRQPPLLETDSISIGRPVANIQVYILDTTLALVPARAYGEIYIGGIGVGRGYCQDPLRTAEVFLPDPFSSQPGSRLYQTGDRARYRPDGSIEFIGRSDDQVKIHGFRIELGEIETHLRHYPGIQDVIVRAGGARQEDKYLIAYVVTSVIISSADLHAFLKGRLPQYMVPTAFVQMETFPVTTNGKVDVQALSQLKVQRVETAYQAPRTAVEQTLAHQWETLLEVESIGLSENFFALGGHSLLATRAVAQIRAEFLVELPLRTLFEAPTIGELAQQIETLMHGENTSHLPALRSVERPAQIPLSFAQQRLWFLHQLDPLSGTYNIPAALRLSGPLSIKALEKSLQQIVQRHESLRTIFVSQQGTPMQVISETSLVQLPLLDLQGLSANVREEQVLLLAQQEALFPFDLETGPLMRIYLLRLENNKHALLFNLHHIIADGWSTGILVNELTALYDAAVKEKRVSLPALPIQYADYALWQHDWLQGERLQEQLDYWQQQLNNVPATLNFPTDRPRPALQTYVGAQQTLLLPTTLSREVMALGQQEGSTLFMTLLASFQVLLMHYTSQQDIVIGTSVANRQQKDLEGLIGCFINTLPLRGDLSGDPSFREVLARTHEVTLQAYSHQDLPFEQLVAQLPLERNLSQQPLFQVAFEFQNFPFTALNMAEVDWSPLAVEQTTSKFDLELTMAQYEGSLRCVLEYNTDLFAASTMRHLLSHFETLLEGIVRSPDQRISTLNLLTSTEREQLLLRNNQTQQQFTSPQHYILCLAQQVARTPERIAVNDQQQQLTYAVLWQRTEQLASILQQRNISPETLVGLYMERSCELLISILAIWRCAAAYIPLDPAYPQERLRLILERTQVPLIVTTAALQQYLPDDNRQLLCLEEIETQHPAEYMPLIPVQMLPQHLAYVIYTSGSTGIPKGVMVDHKGMLNHLRAKVGDLDLHEADIVAQTASQCFDISVWQLFASLLRGGQVQILPDNISHDSFQLLRTIQQTAVSILQIVPAQLGALLDEMAMHPSLQWDGRWLIVTGEAISLSLCQRWWQQQGAIKLLNAYGPTECSDDVTHAILEEQTCSWRVPIGRPIANTQLYILDEYLEPVPPGVVGEIYVGGYGVGRGYLGDAERTAAVFVPDMNSNEPGSRLYRTGDRGRYREDGQLEFVERQDAQVKLRGYRIELGEIETVLGQLLQVKQCVILLQENASQEKQIIAYVVIRQEESERGILDHATDLRRQLKEKLPHYMIPAHFVLLDTLPLTTNGKVNRERLLALNVGKVEPQEEKEAKLLLSPIEELVLQCWKQVLHVQALDVHENFFEVGGHSLLATQVVARLQQLVGIEIPLRMLFEAPTVAEFSTWLTQQIRQDQGLAVPAIVPVPRNQELLLSFAQQRLWFQDQLDPGNTAYSIPMATHLHGPLNRVALGQALAAVIERHEILRTTFPTHKGQPVLQIATAPTTWQRVIDLSLLTPEEQTLAVTQLSQQETRQPFDLAHGPLLRCWLLSLSQHKHVLLLTMHHIISDGWSMDILVREMTTLYTALEQAESANLPALTVQYADYAFWQRQWLQGDILQQQLDYWKQQLADIVPLALPTDYPRPPMQTFEGGHLHLQLPAELCLQAQMLSQQEGVTLFMTLLTVFNILLHYYTSQDDLVVGTNVANRNRAETEEVIGFFVNQLVLRANLSGNPSFRELMHMTREVALGAYVHQDLPFDRLLMELNPERDLSRTPLFQVKFSLEHASDQEVTLPNIHIEADGAVSEVTKFDLFLHVVESEGNLFGSLEYRTDLFSIETIERLLYLFKVIITKVVTKPDIQLDDLKVALIKIDTERQKKQESERRQKNAQKLGQAKRKVSQRAEP